MVFCSMPDFGIRVSVTNRLYVFILFLVRFGLLSGHIFGKSCPLSVPCVLFVYLLFVILVISCFGFECWIRVLIAPNPGLCTLFTFCLEQEHIEHIGYFHGSV